MHEGESHPSVESASVDQFRSHIQSLQEQLKGDATVALIDIGKLTLNEHDIWQEYTHGLSELIATLQDVTRHDSPDESQEEIKQIVGSLKEIGVRSRKNSEQPFYNWLNNRLSAPIMSGGLVLAELVSGNKDFIAQEVPEIIGDLEAEYQKMQMG